MSRITMAIAEQVASKIVEPIDKKIVETEKQIGQKAYDLILSGIPVEIMKVYKKHPEWMRSGHRVRITGTGIGDGDAIYVDMPENLPDTSSSYYRDLIVKGKDADYVVKLDNQIDDLKKKKKQTYDEIYNLLLSMRTYKKVQANLPEVYPYLPNTNEGKEVMVIPSVVREKIACLISTDVEKKCIETI